MRPIQTYILLICLSGLGLILSGFSNEPRPLAVILKYKPDVLIRGANDTDWKAAITAQELYGRDTVRTDADGFALVRFMDKSMVKVKEESFLIIQGEVLGKGSSRSHIIINKGEMLVDVFGRKSRYEIQTPSAVATVLGTSFITLVTDDGSSNYTGISGTVEITASKTGETVQLNANQIVTISYQMGEVKLEPIPQAQVESLRLGFQSLELLAKPKFIELKVIDKNGKVRFIEIPYFERQ